MNDNMGKPLILCPQHRLDLELLSLLSSVPQPLEWLAFALRMSRADLDRALLSLRGRSLVDIPGVKLPIKQRKRIGVWLDWADAARLRESQHYLLHRLTDEYWANGPAQTVAQDPTMPRSPSDQAPCQCAASGFDRHPPAPTPRGSSRPQPHQARRRRGLL